MDFSYNEKWAKEILHLASLDVQTDNESDRFEELLDMSEYPKDKKTVETLMKCLLNDDMGGISETFYGNISQVDYEMYYSALFNLTPEFLETEIGRSLSLYMLKGYSIRAYSEKEWAIIINIIRKNLDQNTLKRLLIIYEEETYTSAGYPYPEFKKIFSELLK